MFTYKVYLFSCLAQFEFIYLINSSIESDLNYQIKIYNS